MILGIVAISCLCGIVLGFLLNRKMFQFATGLSRG